MAMALSGARRETEREMASVLKLHLDRPAMEAANGAVLSGLRRYDQSALAPKCPEGAARKRCPPAANPGLRAVRRRQMRGSDKSLINRRLKPFPLLLCADSLYQTTASICWIAASGVCCKVGDFSLDHGHKSYFPAQN
jgi:hypothetical protein